jgi:hypothetical protein
MITYNDYPHIQTAVESLYDHVDEVLAVDGRFRDFPGEGNLSTDGTYEYLMSLPKAVVISATDLDEVEKRNQYLVGREGDWYVHLDTDEEWVGDFHIPDADMFITWMAASKTAKGRFPKMQRARIFRHIDGLHYEKKHYWLHDGDGDTFALLDRPGKKYTAEVTDETNLIHHQVRSAERCNARQKYYKKLYKREMRIKEHT